MTDVVHSIVLPVLGAGLLYLVLVLAAAWIGGRFGYTPKGFEERFAPRSEFVPKPPSGEWQIEALNALASARLVVARARDATHSQHAAFPADVMAAQLALHRVMARADVPLPSANAVIQVGDLYQRGSIGAAAWRDLSSGSLTAHDRPGTSGNEPDDVLRALATDIVVVETALGRRAAG